MAIEAGNAASGQVLNVRWEAQAAVVELIGDIDMHQTPSLHAAMIELCERQPQPLVLDLQKVPYLDSSALGMLVEVFRRVKAYGGSMRLCGLRDRVRGIFEITHLDRYFSIYPGQAEALAE
jgi:anti-sigma B factor antagonist